MCLFHIFPILSPPFQLSFSPNQRSRLISCYNGYCCSQHRSLSCLQPSHVPGWHKVRDNELRPLSPGHCLLCRISRRFIFFSTFEKNKCFFFFLASNFKRHSNMQLEVLQTDCNELFASEKRTDPFLSSSPSAAPVQLVLV